MRTLYIDCFSGVAGDMMLAGLLDLADHLGVTDAVSVETLTDALRSLELPEWEVKVEERHKMGLRGLGVRVITPWGEEETSDHPHSRDHSHEHSHDHSHDHAHTHQHGLSLTEILSKIQSSSLTSRVKTLAVDAFMALGQAEARAHGVKLESVHFHEVGMIDSIVDIVGSAWCIDALNIHRVIAAPPPINRGWVKCAHGVMPLPTPATSFLLEGIPTSPSPHEVELVTPTGAAMIRAWSAEVTSALSSAPTLAIGWGAGRRDLADRPNLLRLILSERVASIEAGSDLPPTECWLIEANIDDQSPESLATARDTLLALGALDAWLTAIVMKEGRSATQLSVLCEPSRVHDFEGLVLRHTTAIGCRRTRYERAVLPRRLLTVETMFGECRVKVTQTPHSVGTTSWRLKVEHREARALARERGLTLAEVERVVLSRAYAVLQAGQVTWDQLELESRSSQPSEVTMSCTLSDQSDHRPSSDQPSSDQPSADQS